MILAEHFYLDKLGGVRAAESMVFFRGSRVDTGPES